MWECRGRVLVEGARTARIRYQIDPTALTKRNRPCPIVPVRGRDLADVERFRDFTRKGANNEKSPKLIAGQCGREHTTLEDE